MIQKKICMLGGFAVGKTSLVSQFVNRIFSDKYHTTLGVTIDKKTLRLGDQEVNLLLWDLAGEDELHQVRMSYLRGSSGYILVVDGTRRSTLETALRLHQRTIDTIGNVPSVLLLNKVDLLNVWELDEDTVTTLRTQGHHIMMTSAKTGNGVEEAFIYLAMLMRNIAEKKHPADL